MKPVIIKSDKVLEALFKGDEVIYHYIQTKWQG